jgi:hypothetical protein
MSKDPNAGQYQKFYKHEFEMAKLVLKSENIKWSQNDYEAFRFTSKDVNLIFYPHTTSSTGNRSIRVRNSNSKNKARAKNLMSLLYIASGNNNTFSWKGMCMNDTVRIADNKQLRFGWAEDKVRGK